MLSVSRVTRCHVSNWHLSLRVVISTSHCWRIMAKDTRSFDDLFQDPTHQLYWIQSVAWQKLNDRYFLSCLGLTLPAACLTAQSPYTHHNEHIPNVYVCTAHHRMARNNVINHQKTHKHSTDNRPFQCAVQYKQQGNTHSLNEKPIQYTESPFTANETPIQYMKQLPISNPKTPDRRRVVLLRRSRRFESDCASD